MVSFKRLLPVLLVLPLALGLMVEGARLLMAGVAGYQADAFLTAWAKAGSEPAPQAWQVARQAAARAVQLYPAANGAYLDRLGRVYSWQHFQQPFGQKQAAPARRAARQAFRDALAARPVSPFTQARLLHSKLYLLEFDTEFDQAFRRADALGQWQLAVNRELAEVGLIAWPSLTPAQRELTLKHAQRAVAFSLRESQHVMRLAQHTGMTGVLCQHLDTELKTNRKICL